MPAPLPIRDDIPAAELRRAAKLEREGRATRPTESGLFFMTFSRRLYRIAWNRAGDNTTP